VKPRPVIPRIQAVRDVQDAVDFYLREGSGKTALRFVDAVERAYLHLGRFPSAGSHRYAHELDLPGLRSWPVARYPHLIFFLDRGDHVDVWRILHGQRDIPASLAFSQN
jgi:toxin ParE1/3/4